MFTVGVSELRGRVQGNGLQEHREGPGVQTSRQRNIAAGRARAQGVCLNILSSQPQARHRHLILGQRACNITGTVRSHSQVSSCDLTVTTCLSAHHNGAEKVLQYNGDWL